MVSLSVGRLFFTKNDLKWAKLIRKLTTGHKPGKNQSTLPIKKFVSVKVSQFESDVVPLYETRSDSVICLTQTTYSE